MQLSPLITAGLGLVAAAGVALAENFHKVNLKDLGNPLVLDVPVPTVTPGCTKTIKYFPQFTFGPTRTIFTKTKTKFITFDCDGCSKITAIPIGGPGPQLFYTTTVTAKNATTITDRVCAPTPTAVPTTTPECTPPPKPKKGARVHPHGDS